ncbi:MAG: hypothetical protein ACPL09_02160 [Candidatus Methanodesulfokora sp.]
MLRLISLTLKSAVLLSIIMLPFIIITASNINVSISGQSRCLRGFPCSLDIMVQNGDKVRLSVLRLYIYTPWGVFQKEVSTVIDPNSSAKLNIQFTIPPWASASLYPVYPQLDVEDPRYIGVQHVMGGKFLLLVEEPNIYADLTLITNTSEVSPNGWIDLFIAYSTTNMPSGFMPRLIVLANGSVRYMSVLNQTAGSLSVPIKAPDSQGVLVIRALLDYFSGNVSKDTYVTIRSYMIENYTRYFNLILQASEKLNTSKALYLEAKRRGIVIPQNISDCMAKAEISLSDAYREFNSRGPRVMEYVLESENQSEKVLNVLVKSFKEDVRSRLIGVNLTILKLYRLGASVDSLRNATELCSRAYAFLKEDFTTMDKFLKDYDDAINSVDQAEVKLNVLERDLERRMAVSTVALSFFSVLSLVLMIGLIITIWRRKFVERI